MPINAVTDDADADVADADASSLNTRGLYTLEHAFVPWNQFWTIPAERFTQVMDSIWYWQYIDNTRGPLCLWQCLSVSPFFAQLFPHHRLQHHQHRYLHDDTAHPIVGVDISKTGRALFYTSPLTHNFLKSWIIIHFIFLSTFSPWNPTAILTKIFNC